MTVQIIPFKSIKLLLLLIIVAFVISCSKKTVSSNNTSTKSPSYREKYVSITNLNVDIINTVNDYRKSKGLPVLHVLSVASVEAANHSQDMATKKVSFGHSGFNQRAIAIANELKGTSSTGENVASGKMTAKEVLQAWLKSPTHRANIEGKFDYTGVGVAKDKRGVIYYTQIFAKK